MVLNTGLYTVGLLQACVRRTDRQNSYISIVLHIAVLLNFAPSKFQRVSRSGFVIAATSLNGSQPDFARCLAVSWTGTLYIHFRNFARCKIHFASKSCALLYWQRYCTTLEYWASAKLCSRAAITLGVGPLSSCFSVKICRKCSHGTSNNPVDDFTACKLRHCI